MYYEYDASGKLATATDCNGEDTTFAYDIPGRLTQVFNPSYPTTAFVTNTYDSLGRVATQTNATSHTYTYYFSGYRAEEVDPLDHSQVWWFNDRGRTVREVDRTGSWTWFAYDVHDRLMYRTASEGNGVEYEYDAKHNPTTIRRTSKVGSPPDPIVTSLTYESTYNRVETITEPLDRVTTYTYDTHGNLLQIDQPEAGGQVPHTTFTYNSRGQVLAAVDAAGRVKSYAYDASTGDPLSVTVDPATLALTTQLLRDTAGNVTQVTDPRGNATVLEYDAMRRVTQITAPARYVYDGDQVIAECNAAGAVVRRFVSGPGIDEPIRMDVATTPGGWVVTAYYYHFDGLGNVIALTSASGTVIEQYAYDVYGIPSTTSTVGNPYLFNGRQYDAETGLYYYRARYYDPHIGRFLEPDPPGYATGMNLYAYCFNNPLNFLDPFGLASESDCGAVGEPGLVEGMIPIWGSARSAVNAFQTGHPIWGTIHVAMAVSDVFLVKSIVTGVAKTGMKLAGIGVIKEVAEEASAKAAAAEARGGVYLLRDAETGQVMRTGRTGNLLTRRAQHARDPVLKRYEFEPVHQQRGLEQELDWIHNPPLNYQRPISPRNAHLREYLDAANDYLDAVQGIR